MGRVLGVDHGERRTGLAVSDPLGVVARPLAEVRAESTEEMVRRVAAAARENEVERVVVGLPVNMDGTEGRRAREVRTFREGLQAALGGTPVELRDERLTTFEAAGRLEARGRGPDRARLNLEAARIILQTFLDERNS